MKCAFLQLNFTPGDINSNAAAIIKAAKKASAQGAALCLTPALAIAGNAPGDALFYPAFVEKAEESLDMIARELSSTDTALVVGCIGTDKNDSSEAIYNQLALIWKGSSRIVSSCKSPFAGCSKNEKKYFASGSGPAPLEWQGMKIMLAIAEDAFSARAILDIKKEKPDIVAILAARPFIAREFEGHSTTLGGFAKKLNTDVFFLNALGSANGVIFPGRCQWFGKDGVVGARARSFQEDICVFDLKNPGQNVSPYPDSLYSASFSALSFGLDNHMRKSARKYAIICLDGYANSALAATIAARTIKPQNILGIILQSSCADSHCIEDAKNLVKKLGIKSCLLSTDVLRENLDRILTSALAEKTCAPDKTFIQAGINKALFTALSGQDENIVLGCSNKTGLLTGQARIAVSLLADLELAGDLYQTEVYDLCRWINAEMENIIPETMLERKPSAKMPPDENDAHDLPAWQELDAILKLLLEERMPKQAVVSRGHDAKTVDAVANMISKSQYGRIPQAAIIKVNKPVCLNIPEDGSFPFDL